MKKTLTALMLCLVSIMIISCSGKGKQTAAADSGPRWEHIGNIYHYYAPGCGSFSPNLNGEYGRVYVKQIGNKTYYRAIGTIGDVSVVPNPTYGQNDKEGKYRYCFTARDGEVYINF